MANRRLSNSFLSVTVLSATTEAGSFPKENAIDRSSPQRAWRSTSIAADQRVVIDLGAVQTALTVFLDWVNFASMKYQESADGSTGWSDIGITRTVAKDPMHGVYRRVDNITMTSKRYLGIFIPAQTPVDGAAYFRIGTFCVPISILEPDFPETEVGYPFEVSLPESHIIENRFPGGRSEKIKLGDLPPLIISFALRTTVNTNIAGDSVEELADVLRDPTDMIFLDFNLSQNWQAYLVKKSGELRASLSDPAVNTLEFGTVLFEVII